MQRIARGIRGLRPVQQCPEHIVTLGLLRMEDRVLLDAAGLVTDLPTGDADLTSDVTGAHATNLDPGLDSVRQSVAAEETPSSAEIDGQRLVFRVVNPHVDNDVVVSTDGNNLRLRDKAGVPIISDIPSATGSGTSRLTIPYAALGTITEFEVDVAQGEDAVTFDLAVHADAFLSQFSTTVLSKSEDHLRFVGNGKLDATLQLAPRTREVVSLSLASDHQSTDFKFAFTDTIDLARMGSTKVETPTTPITRSPIVLSEGNSFLAPHEEALVVTYGEAVSPIIDIRLHDNANVQIDATGVRGAEKITVVSATNDHQIDNLTLDTGDANTDDVIQVDGGISVAGELTILTDRPEINAPLVAKNVVNVLARGDINFGTGAGITAKFVTLSSSSGQISFVPGTGRIVGQRVDITSAAGIGMSAAPVNTAADNLRLDVTGSGSIFLRDHGSLTLERAHTKNGMIDVSAAGLLRVENVSSQTNSAENDISLRSVSDDVVIAGRIFGGDRNQPNGDVTILATQGGILQESASPNSSIFANHLMLKSAEGIGTANSSVVTSVNELNLEVTGVGSIFVGETSSAFLTSATTQRGTIQVTAGDMMRVGQVQALTDLNGEGVLIAAGNGDIIVDGEIRVASLGGAKSGRVVLDASGDILGDTGHGVADISSRSTVLVAGHDIGQPGSDLEIDVEVLAAKAGGGVWIANQGALLVDSLSSQHGIRAGKHVRLVAESLVTTADISAGDDLHIVTTGANASEAMRVEGNLASDRGSIFLKLNGDGNVTGKMTAQHDLVKAGQGTLTLSTTNDSSVGGQTIVTGGGLVVDGELDATVTRVTSDAFLAGSGQIGGDVTVESGATLRPGSDTGRTLTIAGNLDLHSDASLELTVAAPSAATAVRLVGQFTVDQAVLALSGGAPPAVAGATVTLIDNQRAGPIVGKFVDPGGNIINEGGVVRIGNTEVRVSYTGGVTANDLVVILNGQIFFIPVVDQVEAVAALGIFIPQTKRVQFERTELPVLPVQQSSQPLATTHAIQQTTSDFDVLEDADIELFFRVYDDALELEEPEEISLPPDAISSLPEAFEELGRRGLPDGHYRVYLREAGSTDERLVLDIYVIEGKIVPKNFRDDATNTGDGAANSPVGSEQEGAIEVIEPEDESAGDKVESNE